MVVKKIYQSDKMKVYTPNLSEKIELPFWETCIPAGFPSPADDYMEISLDLNDYLIKNPGSTFFARICGPSMVNSGIYDGDLVIVDRSLDPRNDSILVCAIDGEFTLKRFKRIDRDTAYLMPDNPAFEPIKINTHNAFQVWGVVTYSVHKQY